MLNDHGWNWAAKQTFENVCPGGEENTMGNDLFSGQDFCQPDEVEDELAQNRPVGNGIRRAGIMPVFPKPVIDDEMSAVLNEPMEPDEVIHLSGRKTLIRDVVNNLSLSF